MTATDYSEFDRFAEANGYTREQAPEAFAAWLASKTGKRVSGVALDLSGAVQADPPVEGGFPLPIRRCPPRGFGQ